MDRIRRGGGAVGVEPLAILSDIRLNGHDLTDASSGTNSFH